MDSASSLHILMYLFMGKRSEQLTLPGWGITTQSRKLRLVSVATPCVSLFLCLQVGSFNYDMSRMVFINKFVPNEKDAIQSILDYGIEIRDLNHQGGR